MTWTDRLWHLWQNEDGNIVWGTTPSGGDYTVGVDTPVLAGSNTTGYVSVVTAQPFDRAYAIGYGSRVSGPSTVTLPANQTQTSFVVATTSGTPVDANLDASAFAGTSTITGHQVADNIVWGV